MALGNGFTTGFGNVPAYQISGIPFFTTVLLPKNTDVQIKFPFITNFIHIFTDSTSTAHRVKVGFSPNSIANGKYFETNRLIRNESGIVDPVFEYRCKELFLRQENRGGNMRVSIAAGLTNIPASEFPVDYEAAVYNL